MNDRLDNITLYPIDLDPILAEEVRLRVGREYRLGVYLWSAAIVIALIAEFVFDKPNLRTIITVGVPISWLLLCIQFLKGLDRAPVNRVFKAGARSLRDCVCIRSPGDHVVRYRYSAMRQCCVSMDGLAIKMADDRMLDMPGRVFANSYEMKAFAKTLAEQKNVPVIDMTDREIASVS